MVRLIEWRQLIQCDEELTASSAFLVCTHRKQVWLTELKSFVLLSWHADRVLFAVDSDRPSPIMVHEVTSFDESFLMCVQEQTAFVPHVWVEVATAEAKEIVYCLRSFLPEELEVKSANVFPIDLNVKVHLQVE